MNKRVSRLQAPEAAASSAGGPVRAPRLTRAASSRLSLAPTPRFPLLRLL